MGVLSRTGSGAMVTPTAQPKDSHVYISAENRRRDYFAEEAGFPLVVSCGNSVADWDREREDTQRDCCRGQISALNLAYNWPPGCLSTRSLGQTSMRRTRRKRFSMHGGLPRDSGAKSSLTRSMTPE